MVFFVFSDIPSDTAVTGEERLHNGHSDVRDLEKNSFNPISKHRKSKLEKKTSKCKG